MEKLSHLYPLHLDSKLKCDCTFNEPNWVYLRLKDEDMMVGEKVFLGSSLD